jgi:ribosomal protein S18 acetylase RimI-like enzyme
MWKKKVKIIKSENLDEVLKYRRMIVSSLPILKKKVTKTYLKNRIKGREGEIIKAVLRKKEVGFLTWLKENESTAYIWWIIVNKNYRGNGLGSKLMREALKELTKRGFKKVWAKIKNDNFAALSLFFKFQFYIEGFSNEDGIFTVFVVKNLSKRRVELSKDIKYQTKS